MEQGFKIKIQLKEQEKLKDLVYKHVDYNSYYNYEPNPEKYFKKHVSQPVQTLYILKLLGKYTSVSKKLVDNKLKLSIVNSLTTVIGHL